MIILILATNLQPLTFFSRHFHLTVWIRETTGTFTNSEDPNEMPHNAAFHQGLHCLLR